MNKCKRIKKEVDKTLQLFDNLEDPSPNPYLYTRLLARIQSMEATQQSALTPALLPAGFRLALFSLIIIANIITGVFFLQKQAVQSESKIDNLNIIAKEYYLTQDYYIY